MNHLVQHNKQYHRKALLSSFHLNSHSLGFHPQTQKVRNTLYSIINSTIGKYCSVAFIWMRVIYPQTQRVRCIGSKSGFDSWSKIARKESEYIFNKAVPEKPYTRAWQSQSKFKTAGSIPASFPTYFKLKPSTDFPAQNWSTCQSRLDLRVQQWCNYLIALSRLQKIPLINESTAFRSQQEFVNKEQDGTGGKNAVFGAGKPFTVRP